MLRWILSWFGVPDPESYYVRRGYRYSGPEAGPPEGPGALSPEVYRRALTMLKSDYHRPLRKDVCDAIRPDLYEMLVRFNVVGVIDIETYRRDHGGHDPPCASIFVTDTLLEAPTSRYVATLVTHTDNGRLTIVNNTLGSIITRSGGPENIDVFQIGEEYRRRIQTSV